MNPFNYGNIAKGKYFIGREAELKRLESAMLSADKVLLISPRRYGKTSLAYKLTETLNKNKKAAVIYVDIVACTTIKEFVNKYSNALSKSMESAADKILELFKTILPSLRPQIQVGRDGDFSIQLITQNGASDENEILDKILDLPERLAVKKNRKVVVIFDEFQAISDIDPDKKQQKLLWKIRSKIQNHNHTGYLFAGSQKHLLEKMAIPRVSPFFKMLEIMRLEKIPAVLFISYIENAFKAAGAALKKEVAEYIVKRADNVPYYVLNLCHELYEYSRDNKLPLDTKSVDHCLTSIINNNSSYYENEWTKLSALQKNVLKAISSGYRQNLFSMDTARKFDLRSTGGIQKAIKLLVESQCIIKEKKEYFLDDIWFMEWIKLQLTT